MDEQKNFIDTIEGLKELAVSNGNSLTKKEINDAFADMTLNDAQENMIYAYLAANNINVEEFEGDTSMFESEPEEQVVSDDEREQKFLDMYTEELSDITRLNDAQLYDLYKRFNLGEAVRDSLINAFLPDVIEWVKPLDNKGIDMADLIGEANLYLITAVEDLANEKLVDGHMVKEFVRNEVSEYVSIMANTENESNSIENIALDRVNDLNDCVNRLYGKLGREVTISEAAKEMNVDEEEILNIINISGHKIKNIDYMG